VFHVFFPPTKMNVAGFWVPGVMKIEAAAGFIRYASARETADNDDCVAGYTTSVIAIQAIQQQNRIVGA